MSKKCNTIGCAADAAVRITYVYRHSNITCSDLACRECAGGYARRPVLTNLTITDFPLEVTADQP